MGDPAPLGGFPGGDANAHLRSIPACAALAMRVAPDRGWPIDTYIRADLPAACDAAGRIDAGAALLLADQAMATGVFATLAAPRPMLTLDLRADWLGEMPADTLHCVIDDVHHDGDLALVRAVLIATQARVGTVTSRYLVGAMPGGVAEIEQDGGAGPISSAASFEAYLGACRVGDDLRIDPRPDHVGARVLPAFHGGVIAAFLERAARCVSGAFRTIDIEVRYLAAARADQPLFARTNPQRLGRRAATIDVAAYQRSPDRPVAIARVLAMRDEPGPTSAFVFPPQE